MNHNEAQVFANIGISAVGKSRWPFALALITGIRDRELVPDVVSFNSAASGCQAKWELSCFLQSMSPRKDTVGHNAVNIALARAWQWQSSLCMVHLMPVLRLQPNIRCLTGALSACEQASLWKRGLSLEVWSLRMEPDTMFWSTLLSSCGKASQWQLALAMLAKASAPDAVLYATAISAVNAARSDGHANGTARDAELSSELSSEGSSSSSSSSSWEAAVAVLEDMKRTAVQVTASVFQLVIHSCRPRWQLPMLFLQDMQTRVALDQASLNAAISGADAENWDKDWDGDVQPNEILECNLPFLHLAGQDSSHVGCSLCCFSSARIGFASQSVIDDQKQTVSRQQWELGAGRAGSRFVSSSHLGRIETEVRLALPREALMLAARSQSRLDLIGSNSAISSCRERWEVAGELLFQQSIHNIEADTWQIEWLQFWSGISKFPSLFQA